MRIIRSGLVVLAATATATLALPLAAAGAATPNLVSDGDFSSPTYPSTSLATYCVTGDTTGRSTLRRGHVLVMDTDRRLGRHIRQRLHLHPGSPHGSDHDPGGGHGRERSGHHHAAAGVSGAEHDL
jgi:hypothetical protein